VTPIIVKFPKIGVISTKLHFTTSILNSLKVTVPWKSTRVDSWLLLSFSLPFPNGETTERRKCINKKIKLESFAQESNLITFISDPENGKWCRW
jgi:hypothetical protein